MSEAIKLRVETRDPEKNKGTGTRASRRLRKTGRIPAVIYGHKQAVVPISLSALDARSMIEAASHLAELDLGDQTETVLIRDVQWDHLGREILHVDFARVNKEELIETEVELEYKGDPVGVGEGGLLETIVRTLTVKCPAGAIPDSIKVDVSGLALNGSIHVRDLQLPAGVVVEADPDVLLVHVVPPAQDVEPSTAAADAVQPEVIKPERKDKEAE
ncbi:50S ribosomal protein L25 [Paludisphaera mucosa]|uniref:Large ribosomal subunit protein bL25 n=1 Tax=Paludisphaera mucosa TaxID=3030827 RepID=A0ABT6FH47_9BACT|nr:50S ribosomal protein L25 [Paludisphaera mucosa]MDG3006715.1 50S ribosomal protein L25 [Paludisphaera mucosa]